MATITIRRNGQVLNEKNAVSAYHWFELTPERKIKCIRIFKDPAGWVAVYDEPAVSKSAQA